MVFFPFRCFIGGVRESHVNVFSYSFAVGALGVRAQGDSPAFALGLQNLSLESPPPREGKESRVMGAVEERASSTRAAAAASGRGDGTSPSVILSQGIEGLSLQSPADQRQQSRLDARS